MYQKLRFTILTGILFLMGISAFAQPSANFTSNRTAGCEPLTVVFTDQSNAPNSSIASWLWEANGNFFSSSENPTFLIDNPGQYTICLTVTDQNGATNQNCKNDFIEVYRKPTASYSADQQIGCTPLAVNLTSTSTTDNGNITSWVWDLGGPCGIVPGNASAQVACTYTMAGTYQPTLIVTDTRGCENSVTVEDFITVIPDPDIQISAINTFACDPPFTTSFSNDNVEMGTTYRWDFGNGDTYIGIVPPSVTYDDPGTYTVTVEATNSSGCSKTLTLEDYIQVGHEVSFSFTSDGGCGDLDINFFDNSAEGATSIVFDFGDGNTSTFGNTSHTYAGPGCYDVILTRTVNGCTNSLTRLLCITDPQDMDVTATVQNRLGCELPHTVDFEGISPVAESWLWTFGDGTTSTEQSPTKVYDSFGNYSVSLTVTDAFGCEKVVSTQNVIIRPLKVFITEASSAQGCLPLSFTLVDSAQSVSPIVAWNWRILDVDNNVIFSSTAAQPSGMLNQEGCFNIELQVENDLGCRETKLFPSAICAGNQPTVDFSGAPRTVCASDKVRFTDLSDSSVNSWAWDLDGDGAFDSFEANPEYSYRDTGCFDVTLMVGSFGCTNIVTFPDYICIAPPVAKFRTRLDCVTPFDREFSSQAIGADSVFWDFGVPGVTTDTSSLIGTNFLYPFKDTFVVTMIAFNFAEGCTDTIRNEVIITEVEANFTLRSDQGCAPMELDLNNTSIDANRYEWTAVGGDISARRGFEPRIIFDDPGQYEVELIARDVNNCRDTFLYEPIFANEIEANFSTQQLTDCLPVDVQLTDLSTNLYSNIIRWDWVFGEIDDTIGIASGDNLIYTFDQAGFIPTQLVVTDAWGCVDSIRLNEGINVNAPFAAFEVDSFSCPGLDLAFVNQSVGTNLDYDWNFGDGTMNTSIENPTHEYPLGTYTASLTISTPTCSNTFSQEIIVQSVEADFTLDPNFPPCPPSTVNFNNFSNNAQEFLWLFGDNSGSSDQESHIYNEKGFFDVTLIAIGANPDCRDTLALDSLVAIQGPSGDFSYLVDNSCIPAEVTFYGESDRPYTYTWFLDDGNTVLAADAMTDTFTYTYTEVAPDGYIPKLMLASTCDTILVSPDTIFVTDLQVDFMASDTFLCDGEQMVAFESIVETNTDDYQTNWTFQGGNPNTSNQSDLAVEYLQAGIFDVNLSVTSGDCEAEVSKPALIEVVDFVDLMTVDQVICQGDTVQLELTTNATEFDWTPIENIDDPMVQNPLVHPSTSTDYIVTGSYRSCNTASDTVRVDVLPSPRVVFNPIRRYFPGQSLMLEVRPENPAEEYSYDWFPQTGLSCASCPNPTVTPDTSMIYTIMVTNVESGCFTEVTMQVRELTSCPEDLIFMPNIFSPNGDGSNDEFKMFSSNIFEIDYLRIFDRWGALVWESTDANEGWDGTYRGKPVNPGVYIYALEAPCILDDSKILKKGGITVMR